MLLPPGGLFSESLLQELDLQRLSDYYLTFQPTPTPNTTNTPALMEIVRESEGLEQDLCPFPSTLLKPLNSLPPGRLPGATFSVNPSDPVSSELFPSAAVTESPSKKRARLDNVTIQHF